MPACPSCQAQNVAGALFAAAIALGVSAQQPTRSYIPLTSLERLVNATHTATAPPSSSRTPTATSTTSAATATSTTASGSVTATRTATASPTATLGASCHPSYPDFCIPPPPPDLDCSSPGLRNLPGYRAPFRVIHTVSNPDPHRLDGDRDGTACETV
ncbi:MAG: excalibur calcium-binding domain-containing protein [Thermomicrobiales bacterium]|nr:excalibur calcium-binding domain-containing protein [Thermomicrobiales bacterium]